MCGDTSDAFTFKSGKIFSTSIAPYYSSSGYSKYGSSLQSLEKKDDVANIILGGKWRMPTPAEYLAMRNATYWVWDATAHGYYIFSPDSSHPAGGRSDSYGGLNKMNALLFFPAAGCGSSNTLYGGGSYGYNWSNRVYVGNVSYAHLSYFSGGVISPQDNDSRSRGVPVRPVSD